MVLKMQTQRGPPSVQIVTRSRRQTALCLLMQKEELQAFEASNRSSVVFSGCRDVLEGYLQLQATDDTGVERARDSELESHSDADFAADKLDRKSLTGGVIFLNGMAVSWTAKKQGGVSLSTMEAEFVAASEQTRELLGIREMLREIGMPPGLPMTLYIDNQAAIKQLDGEASSLKAKLIDVRLKFVRDYSRREIIQAQYVRSEAQVADLMTKALDAAKLALLCELMSLG
uniref:Uncharacterized protein n=1 Tax=Peronospora matthiolae TaxID=2874970 RepID=A0AAV1UB90_9STRA